LYILEHVASCSYNGLVKAVGIRELKNRLSEYIRVVRGGEGVLVTDRGEVVAELRPASESPPPEVAYPGLTKLAREGKARLGAANRPEVYPRLAPLLSKGQSARLLAEERTER
jgi:prevent-host-death family protein